MRDIEARIARLEARFSNPKPGEFLPSHDIDPPRIDPVASQAYRLSSKSRRKLSGVHQDLVRVVENAIGLTTVDFVVLEGLRTIERQRNLLAAGASQTLNSRHLTGHAVDLGALVDGQVDWSWPLYHKIAEAMKRAADLEDVPIEWGGDWASFPDGGHFQLTRDRYP